MKHVILAGLVLCAASYGVPAAAQSQWDTYGRVSKVTCQGRPVLLQGNHTDVTVTGPCRYVRVAGAHNDVTVDVAPGATIEITGAHNDVWWRSRIPGPRPVLLDHGESNTFHRGGED